MSFALRRISSSGILFAGDPGNAQVLLQAVAQEVKMQPRSSHKWVPTVILSDTAVPPTPTSVEYNNVVNLTDQSDASYYTDASQPNGYGLDAVTVAVDLLKELDERGFDWKLTLKSTPLNHANAVDVRRNLVRLLREDFKFHSSYRGAEDTGPIKGLTTAYTFDCPLVRRDGRIERKSDGSVEYCQRYGGIFHVWNWNPQKQAMTDVDPWHPPRVLTPR
jgi:hypothetical protein